MLTYAISSQKGGVGKTTTAINLGAALAIEGKRVLLVDFDPQGSLTAAVGKKSGIVTLGDVLLDPSKVLSAISPCTGNMQVISAGATLANVLLDIPDMDDAAFRLSNALSQVAGCYDYIFIDCAPTLGHVTTNAMTAANVALVPLQCEFLSLRGLADVQEIALAIQETTNPELRMRVVATMFDRRTINARDVLDEARTALPGLVYETVIPRTVRLAEAPAMGQTIFEYAPESNGAFGYQALAQEILLEDAGYGATEGHQSSDAEPSFTYSFA